MIFKTLQLLNIVFIQSIIYLIAKIFPKDKNLTVIGSSLGRHFADNSKYLYLYFHQNNVDRSKKMVWITKNKKVYKDLELLSLPCEYLYSVKGIFYTIRASKVFITHQLKDINGALISGSEIIQLWHGMPIRKIGCGGDWLPTTLNGKLQIILSKLFPYAYYMKCDKLVAFSAISKTMFREPFSISFRNKKFDENILLLGQPRNDALNKEYLFDKKIFSELEELEGYKNKYSKIVSWLPTHRSLMKKTIIDIIKESNFDLVYLDGYFRENNILLVIKVHFLELHLLENLISKSSNIILYKIADPYPLLSFTDILITDYSSVYFDFLITNRPMIFAPFDFEEYKNTVDFYYEYNSITPGEKCYTWPKIISELNNILYNKDKFVSDRKLLLTENQFISNENSKKILSHFDLITA